MIDVLDEKEQYLSAFAALEKDAAKPAWMLRQRKAAIARFAELGFPTQRDEEWRFTNVMPLARASFKPVPRLDTLGLSIDKLHWASLWLEDCYRLVFVNGHLAAELSALAGLPDGLVLAGLRQKLEEGAGQLEPHLGRHARSQNHAFVALNTALFRDGAYVAIPKGMVVSRPIHLVFVSTVPDEATVSHPRNLILAGVNSQATILESYVGFDSEVYFTNAVTEAVLAENAVVDHYKLQQESIEAFHVATLQVRQERGSNFSSRSIAFGGGLVRNDVNAVLDAEGCECTLNGLYLGHGRQLIDNHTRIDHAKPHCTSHELYKGILDGKARGVFNGKIYVHPDAQKTDAKQTNKTLLLSPEAVIDTKPQLEIFADDVKCTHGATIGQLAEEAIFYLRSRGIGRNEARSLLTFAFANDIVGRVKVEPIRRQLEDLLLAGQDLPAGRTVVEGRS